MNRRRRKNRKWVKVVILLVLLIVAGVICYLVWDAYFREQYPVEIVDTEVIENPETEEKPEEGEKKDEEPVVKKEEVIQYEGENPNESAGLTGNVTYAGVVDGTLRVGVNIDQFVSGGNCELYLMKDGVNIYTASAELAAVAATATCQGFDVPTVGLGNGVAQIVINISAGGKTGVIRGEVAL